MPQDAGEPARVGRPSRERRKELSRPFRRFRLDREVDRVRAVVVETDPSASAAASRLCTPDFTMRDREEVVDALAHRLMTRGFEPGTDWKPNAEGSWLEDAIGAVIGSLLEEPE